MVLSLGKSPGTSVVESRRVHGVNVALGSNIVRNDSGAGALAASDFEDAVARFDVEGVEQVDAVEGLGDFDGESFSVFHFIGDSDFFGLGVGGGDVCVGRHFNGIFRISTLMLKR